MRAAAPLLLVLALAASTQALNDDLLSIDACAVKAACSAEVHEVQQARSTNSVVADGITASCWNSDVALLAELTMECADCATFPFSSNADVCAGCKVELAKHLDDVLCLDDVRGRLLDVLGDEDQEAETAEEEDEPVEELYAAPATASFDLVYDENEDYTPLCDYIKAVGGSNVNQDKACTYSAGSVIVEFEVQFTEAELQSAGSSADEAASFVDGLIAENTAVQLPEIDGQAVSAPTIAVTSAPVVADESDDDDAEDDDDSDPIVSEGAAVHSNAIVGATIVAAAALTCSM